MGRDEERLEFLKSYEKKLIEEGTKLIVGIDEAGRGPLAGPVSVGAVIMKPESNLKWVNDSKKVTEKRREVLYDQIIEDAIVWDVEIVTQSEIDEYNILEATKIGLNRCIKKIIDKLGEKPDLILLDEPTNALDEESVRKLLDILREEKGRGACIVLASHDMEELTLLSDIIFIMEEGRLREA